MTDPNRQALEAFARFFDPPLAIAQTQAVGGQRVANGWMCALHLPDHEIGLTAVCWGKGYFKAWVEATGTRDDAQKTAFVLRRLLDGLVRPIEARPGQEETPASALPDTSSSAAADERRDDLMHSSDTPLPAVPCEHDFRHRAGDPIAHCWKCGASRPKPAMRAIDPDAEHAAYLAKVAEQQAAYDAEKANAASQAPEKSAS